MAVSPAATGQYNSLLEDYIAQNQAATAVAKQKMADNVQSGLNASSTAGLAGNFNTFLKILTTQLQNQDPTAPMDTNQFTQQLVQFSGVEQQINTNKLLQQLVSATGGSGVKSLLGFVGQYVEVPANNQLLIQGGQASLAYTLPGEAKSVTLTIKDASGKTVTTLSGPTTLGLNRLVWDGKDGSGNQLADGVYSLSIAATDSAKKPVAISDIRLTGLVTGVQTADSNGNDLLLGPSLAVSDANVGAVFAPNAVPQPAPSS
ncbi:MAG: flagellar hook assembly protein FlgD [Bdellovibrionales bacterium]